MRDTITARVRYHDGAENYTMIAVDGQRPKVCDWRKPVAKGTFGA